MTMLVDLREKIKRLYGQYGVYVQIAAKFLLALAILLFIGAALPFNAVLGNIFVQLILALICSIIPLQGIALVGCLAVVGQCFSLSAEVGVLAVILLLAVLLLYFRITPKDSLALVLTPLAFGIGIPAAVPMGFGLVGGIGSCLSSGCGVIFYTFIHAIQTHLEELQNPELEMLKRSKIILDSMMKEDNLIVLVILFAAVTIIVNAVRRLSVDYSWYLAIGTGAVAYLAISIAVSIFSGNSGSLLPTILGVAGAVVVSLILQFFLFHVDYRRTEYLEYEDDEYHYYVKAVPKVVADLAVRPKRAAAEPEVQDTGAAAEDGSELGEEHASPVVAPPEVETIDFESKLEESLKDL